jgi:hypothetical protein
VWKRHPSRILGRTDPSKMCDVLLGRVLANESALVDIRLLPQKRF